MSRKGLGEPMSENDSAFAARAADVLLRAMGGRCVKLRAPAPAVPADPTEQLGLATPAFEDIPMAPVVFRKTRASVSGGKPARWELLVSARAIESIVGSLAFESASVLFAQAAGVLVDDELLEIVSATAEQAAGQPYVYRLIVRAPQSQLT
jgi:hypothetical protein